MSTNLPGNPHVFEGPQIADPETTNQAFFAEEGITAETMILSELARNTESNLAVAHEIRTQTLVQLHVHNASMAEKAFGPKFEDVPEWVVETLQAREN